VKFLLICVLAGAVALAATPARAAEPDQKAARPHYEKGATEYNLGHFADAISEFEKAYELDPAPVLLFNIAQAHRQGGNNERAAFFYRRYLEQAPNAANRAEVEKRIKDLEEAIRQQNDLKRRPPTEVAHNDHDLPTAQQVDAASPPTTTPTTTAAQPTGAAAATAGSGPVSTVTGQAPESEDHRFRLTLSAGPAFPKFSGKTLDQPTLLSVRAGAGYTFDVAPLQAIDLGLSLAYAPIQYRTTDTNTSETAGFWGLMVGGTYRYRVIPELDIKGELGAGVVWWTGLGSANPFTVGGAGASGPVPMPSLLVGVGADYRLPHSVFLFAEPALVVSKTTGDGLSAAVSSVLRIDIAIGIGYVI
jgi:hypothetical protein